jgi:hypothetical protein
LNHSLIRTKINKEQSEDYPFAFSIRLYNTTYPVRFKDYFEMLVLRRFNGEVNGKIKTQTQSGQQKKTRPMESKT